MALRIYYSDRIEDLAADLKERLLTERAKDKSFEFSQVVVPNTNIAKWLQIRVFADSPSLCMGVEFPFIEQRLFGLLSESVDGERRPQLLQMNAYANAIMSILLKDDDEKLAPFRRYIAEGDAGPLKIDTRSKARMAWQLAVKHILDVDFYEILVGLCFHLYVSGKSRRFVSLFYQRIRRFHQRTAHDIFRFCLLIKKLHCINSI